MFKKKKQAESIEPKEERIDTIEQSEESVSATDSQPDLSESGSIQPQNSNEPDPPRKEKKSAVWWKKYLVIIIVLVVALAAVAAVGIVHNQKGKTAKSTAGQKAAVSTTEMTTKPDVTTPGSPLTYSDFSFGGRTVKEYTNFIDLCEKEGGSHNYYFDSASEACKKANRGINVDDTIAYVDGADNYWSNGMDNNTIFDQYGETTELKRQYGSNDPSFLPPTSELDMASYCKYDYSFKKGKHTYHKTFYLVITDLAGAYILQGIEYTMD